MTVEYIHTGAQACIVITSQSFSITTGQVQNHWLRPAVKPCTWEAGLMTKYEFSAKHWKGPSGATVK